MLQELPRCLSTRDVALLYRRIQLGELPNDTRRHLTAWSATTFPPLPSPYRFAHTHKDTAPPSKRLPQHLRRDFSPFISSYSSILHAFFQPLFFLFCFRSPPLYSHPEEIKRRTVFASASYLYLHTSCDTDWRTKKSKPREPHTFYPPTRASRLNRLLVKLDTSKTITGPRDLARSRLDIV